MISLLSDWRARLLKLLAKAYGVSKQAIQYHENKDAVRELRSIMLKRAAEIIGDAIGQMALEKFKSKDKTKDEDD